MAAIAEPVGAELLERWNTEQDLARRDEILVELERRGLFPSEFQADWERSTGAYPSLEDPLFIPKLLKHREFAESKQTTWQPRRDVCTTTEEFEITPVQRFVANFMSPRSPYMSMLLYHGVGVGKTCAAVQIAEAWLDNFPRSKVIIVAPPTIQSGFYRTIFDITRVKIGEDEEPNSAVQCTGDLYLQLSGTTMERDVERIERRVKKTINRRYAIYGYREFANYVRDLLKRIPADLNPERRAEQENRILNGEFGSKLMIIDEVHNLRDVGDLPAEDESAAAAAMEPHAAGENAPAGGEAETGDTKQGKILTPYIKKVLEYAEGMKLAFLTATPMYNTYREIIFLFNLLLLNDKKAQLIETDIFTRDGQFRPGGEARLGKIAQRYVSFMRGENPSSFPLRFYPLPGKVPALAQYPALSPRGIAVPDADKVFVNSLPIIPLELHNETLSATLEAMESLPGGMGGLNYMLVERLVSAGNFVVPPVGAEGGSALARSRADSLALHFRRETVAGELKYVPRAGPDGVSWLAESNIGNYSQKFEFFLKTARNADGVVFAYLRYVNSGAIPLALVLEANGYTPYGRKSRLLGAPIQSSGRRQCALCPRRESGHDGSDHAFRPAYYAIITGDKELGVKNVASIAAEREAGNKDGEIIKIVIGSQVAAEGVDFKYVREVHIMDSWYHLNRLEQIIGRGIRFCSHAALPTEKRNTTIYQYASVLPPEYNRETGDLYSYRVAFKKGQQVGQVSRVMKQYAIDCNLNHDAILIQDSRKISQVDSQRNRRPDVPIRDMDFTAICDWIECDYRCVPDVDVNVMESDDSTYDSFAARWRVAELKKRLRLAFSDQNFYETERLRNRFADVPEIAYLNLLRETIDNKNFRMTNNSGIDGYIRYCNKYYVFQPYSYTDIRIPLAIRSAKFPIKRDEYEPRTIETVLPAGAAAAAAARIPLPAAAAAATATATAAPAPEPAPEPAAVAATARRAPAILARLPEVVFNYAEPWRATQAWIGRLIRGSETSEDTGKDDAFPKEIREDWIPHVAQDSNPVIIKLIQILHMVVAFVKAWRNSGGRAAEKTESILLDFFWDNWLTKEEQLDAVYKDLGGARERMGSSIYRYDTLDVLRVINPENGQILYYCRDRTPCVRSIRDDIVRSTADLPENKITERHTGFLYGFLAPKDGALVFKTNQPPKDGEKLGRGSECGNVSTTRDHLKKIDSLIREITEKRGGNWSRAGILLENSVRACTLLELLLRWMNAVELGGKRWFYRAVQANIAGHKGFFHGATVGADGAAADAAPPKRRGLKKKIDL